MGSRHLSLRISESLYKKLEHDAEDSWSETTVSELARTLIDEGLRMAAHPGIFFNPGPAGRRAHLMEGPDVWQLIDIYQEMSGAEGDAIASTAEHLGIGKHWVEVALRYYSEYRDEIDAMIARNAAESERATKSGSVVKKPLSS